MFVWQYVCLALICINFYRISMLSESLGVPPVLYYRPNTIGGRRHTACHPCIRIPIHRAQKIPTYMHLFCWPHLQLAFSDDDDNRVTGDAAAHPDPCRQCRHAVENRRSTKIRGVCAPRAFPPATGADVDARSRPSTLLGAPRRCREESRTGRDSTADCRPCVEAARD